MPHVRTCVRAQVSTLSQPFPDATIKSAFIACSTQPTGYLRPSTHDTGRYRHPDPLPRGVLGDGGFLLAREFLYPRFCVVSRAAQDPRKGGSPAIEIASGTLEEVPPPRLGISVAIFYHCHTYCCGYALRVCDTRCAVRYAGCRIRHFSRTGLQYREARARQLLGVPAKLTHGITASVGSTSLCPGRENPGARRSPLQLAGRFCMDATKSTMMGARERPTAAATTHESNAPGEGRAIHFGPSGSGTIDDGGTDSRQHTSASELLAICRPGALDQAQVRTKGASRAR